MATREYVEFSLDGEILGRYPAAPMGPGQTLAGVALCSTAGLFAGRLTYGRAGSLEGWDVLALDRNTRAWRVVSGKPTGIAGWVYGCEGERLVTWSRTTAGLPELDFWKPGPPL